MRGRFSLVIVASLAIAAVTLGPRGARADSASRSAAASQGAVVRAGGETETLPLPPTRERMPFAELYVPAFFHAVDGKYDLVVHFHGIPSLQERNFEQARVNAVVVSVNLGLASDAYANAYRVPGAFDALLAQTQHALDRTGRAPGARLGRIALEAWSAGFAAIGTILGQPGNADRIDAILLADGPHANYLAPHRVNDAAIEKWARFAESAKRGDKLFALTHSSIATTGYPSTTETVGRLLELASVEKTPTTAIGPRGMREIYESHRGSFHVEGFEGQAAKDHIDHIKGMGETLLPFLRARWGR